MLEGGAPNGLEAGLAAWPADSARVPRTLAAQASASARHAQALARTYSTATSKSKSKWELAAKRAVAAAERAVAAVAADNEGALRETQRAVAAAELAVHDVDWPQRVAAALARIALQKREFDGQWRHWVKHGVLPQNVRAVAAEQLLDAIGAIALGCVGLLEQAEMEVVRDGWFPDGEGIGGRLAAELPGLPAAVAAFTRWGLALPPRLRSLDPTDVLALCRTLPLAATDPAVISGGVGAVEGAGTVQRVLGALVVTGGADTLRHLTWVEFDAKGDVVFPRTRLRDWRKGSAAVYRPETVSKECSLIDEAIAVFRKRQAEATAAVAAAVIDDVVAYRAAREAAVALPDAPAAIDALQRAVTLVPQRWNPGATATGEGKAGATESAREDTECGGEVVERRAVDGSALPPLPTALEYVVYTQRRAATGSARLYALVSTVAAAGGSSVAVLPGGVKKLPRTLFKAAVKYRCDLSRITDQIRCTVVADTVAELAAVLRAMLDSPCLAVTRIKNRIAPEYDATVGGGYMDVQTMVGFEVSPGGPLITGEVQLNLRSLLRIKEAPGGGHMLFNYARSLRAYDEASYRYAGTFNPGVAARIAAGAVLEVNLRGGCLDRGQRVGDGSKSDAADDGRATTRGPPRLERVVMHAHGSGADAPSKSSHQSEGKGALAAVTESLTSATCRVSSLDLSCNKMTPAGAAALAPALQTSTCLALLDLSSNELGEAGVAAVSGGLEANRSVRTLILGSNRAGDVGAAALAVMLERNRSIVTAHLGSNGIGDAGAAALADGLRDNAQLTSLDLSVNSVGDRGAAAIGRCLGVGGALVHLDLSENQIGDSGARALALGLRNNARLASLRLADNQIADDGAEALAEALKVNQGLGMLHLAGNQIGDRGVEGVAGALPLNSTLATLHLSGNHVGDAGAEALTTGLKENTGLTTLHLSDNCIMDPGAAALATWLETNRVLTTLHLSENQIGDDGASALAEGFRASACLASIHLSENQIGDSGAAALAQGLKGNRSLSTIHLEGIPTGPNGRAALADVATENPAVVVHQ